MASMTLKIGLIGWRGMVGTVLLERLFQEGDLEGHQLTLFSESQAGKLIAPLPAIPPSLVEDAGSLERLEAQDILLSCQGGSYSEKIHPQLRARGWGGYWIDAASTLRSSPESVIVLDPLNRSLIERALNDGVLDYVGGNCTVSLMLLALHGLINAGLIEWVSVMSYQAASGAGAAGVQELLGQLRQLPGNPPRSPLSTIDEAERCLWEHTPQPILGAPLAVNLIPWIDREMPEGRSREEWKGQVEAEKILGYGSRLGSWGAPITSHPFAIDGLCVRVPTLRCHAQALTIKLREPVSLERAEELIEQANPWVELVPNTRSESLKGLSPAACSGSLKIAVGRLRKLRFGEEYLTLFTVGDQLLWGAAEPLRRVLQMIIDWERSAR